ncbi:hypothetical protein [Legionella bononiensis]|uniref:Uncharacterized protein n=1 Tax=Legionella bononiensis TaxID=2793102 RepID=A0ABS1W956_9GAMM|nr:hypothetical protein [Legionella bononiensis]MBL7479601.1 hypothetical protein [Legionella bononiensis]MBL7525887.1 hypothetical protein [Legionella bononiensis]MBL7562307.1 hypothetical protein [Legionella bononiensis]
MDINSTSKMLAKMHGQKKSSGTSTVFAEDSSEPIDANTNQFTSTPQLKPSNKMEDVLTNSLRANLSKEFSPME